MTENFYSQVILSIIFLSIVTFFGFIFSNKILKEKNIFFLIPLSATLGSSVFITVLHFLSMVLGLETSTYITITLFILGIISLKLLSIKTQTENILNKRQTIALFSLSFFLFVLCSMYLIAFNTFDPLYHNTATLIKQKAYPPFSTYNSEELNSYHYGLILFSASLSIFSKLDVWNSFIPIQVLFIFTIPLAIFSLIYHIRKSFTEAFFSSLLGCFCANLNSYLIFKHLSNLIVHGYNFQAFQKIRSIGDSSFATNTTRSLISPNMCIATQMLLVLSLLLITYKIEKLNKEAIIKWVSLLIISSVFFFIYESFWIVPIISSFIYHIFSTKNKTQILKALIPIFLIVTISPFIFGGILSNAEKSSASLIYLKPKFYFTSYTHGSLTTPNQEYISSHIITENSTNGLYFKITPSDWRFYNDFGLAFICLPLILYWIIKEKSIGLFGLFISSVAMFIVPFFISFKIRDVELIRFPTCARFLFTILLGAFLGYLIKKCNTNLIYKLAFLLLIFTLISPVLISLYPHPDRYKDWRYVHISPLNKKAIKWLSQYVQEGDKGIGPFNNPTFYFDLITTAGIYGTSTTNTGGFIVEHATRKTLLETLDPCLFKELKARWLFLDKDVSSLIKKGNLDTDIKNNNLELRYSDKDKSNFVEIYEYIPSYTTNDCKNKNYRWSVGRVYLGEFFPLQNNITKEKVIFENKENAKEFLKEFTKTLNKDERYWYRIEAITLDK